MNAIAPGLDGYAQRQRRKQELREDELFGELVNEALLDKSWAAAESIGGGYDGTDGYSDEEIAAYARGARVWLTALAERLEVSVDRKFDQMEAAVGERLRRRASKNEKLRHRGLSNLARAIRDKRIAMLDRYEGLDYKTEFCPLQRKFERISRSDHAQGDTFWNEAQLVRKELDALYNLWQHLIQDKEWYRRHYELGKPRPAPTLEGQSLVTSSPTTP